MRNKSPKTSPKPYQSLVLLSLVLVIYLSGCATDDSSKNAVISAQLQARLYSTLDDSTALIDSRLRELFPSQRQGAFGLVKMGDEDGLALDYIAMDSSVTFLDSIPAGSVVLACTLWVKLGTLSDNDGDSVVMDLWNIPENWNEKEVSWNSRTTDLLWQAAGGRGQLIKTALIRVKRISLFAFEWRINGELYDTLQLQDAQEVPIPIVTSLAQQNLERTSFGLALRRNPATSNNARFSFVTRDNLQEVNRPYMVWVFR